MLLCAGIAWRIKCEKYALSYFILFFWCKMEVWISGCCIYSIVFQNLDEVQSYILLERSLESSHAAASSFVQEFVHVVSSLLRFPRSIFCTSRKAFFSCFGDCRMLEFLRYIILILYIWGHIEIVWVQLIF